MVNKVELLNFNEEKPTLLLNIQTYKNCEQEKWKNYIVSKTQLWKIFNTKEKYVAVNQTDK